MKIQRLHEYLQNLNPYTPQELLLMAVLVKLSQVAGINRVQVRSDIVDTPDKTTPANLYGITFLESGAGKDKPLRDMDANVLDDVIEDFKARSLLYKEEHNEKIHRMADEKYGAKNSAEKTKYIQGNEARFLPQEISDATLEGFTAVREAYSTAGFGGTFVKISEFGDYITVDNKVRVQFLSIVSEIFDHGSSNAKIIKGEKTGEAVIGVPSTAIFHTSLAGLLEGKNHDLLFDFMNRSLARRSFICYPVISDMPSLGVSELVKVQNEKRKKAQSMVSEIKKYVWDMYIHTRKPDDVVYHDENIFTLTPDANTLIQEYQIENLLLSRKIPEDSSQAGIKSDMANRYWKVLKLSGIIAASEHPEKKTVEVEDLEYAIQICALYSTHIERFYKASPTAEYEKLYHHFAKTAGVWSTTMELRDQGFVNKNTFKKWFDDNIAVVAEMLESAGYIFEEGKHGNRGMKYRATRMSEPVEDEKMITISQGRTNSPTETTFIRKELPFHALHMETKKDQAWSATTYKNDKRSDENAVGNIDLMVFDIDDNQTIRECIANLTARHIRALITTTRNHRKKKQTATGEKPPVDRFRVVIPLLHTSSFTKDEYKAKIRAVAHALDIPTDPATCNISRLWFGNPEQKYKYIDGGYIDPSVFVEVQDAPKVMQAYQAGGNSSGIKKWFSQNWERYGGRNNTLYIASRFFLNDKGEPPDRVKEYVLEINNLFQNPLNVEEIEKTMFKSLDKKS